MSLTPFLPCPITLKHSRTFAVGVDVGQAHDPTATCVASRIVATPLNPMKQTLVYWWFPNLAEGLTAAHSRS